MERSSILSHRGFFFDSAEQNTLLSLNRAIDIGFGIETDIRDLNGSLVISHDPPIETANPISLEFFLNHLSSKNYNGRVALNIKSDGLASSIKSLFVQSSFDLASVFFFDMSVPDSLSYIKAGLPIYSRISEYESEPAFCTQSSGVWIDNFSGTYPQIQRAIEFLTSGLHVTVVSPELHGRSYASLWDEILVSKIHLNPLFELCTDFPSQAFEFFSGSDR